MKREVEGRIVLAGYQRRSDEGFSRSYLEADTGDLHSILQEVLLDISALLTLLRKEPLTRKVAAL